VYTSLAILIERIGEAEIIRLTDDESTGAVVASRVTAAITEADAVIEGYLRGRYPVPLTPVPPVIAKLAADLAIHNLYQRRFGLEMPDGLEKLQDTALKMLREIQAGKLSLGVEEADTPRQAGEYRTNKTADDRVFSREDWEAFK